VPFAEKFWKKYYAPITNPFGRVASSCLPKCHATRTPNWYHCTGRFLETFLWLNGQDNRPRVHHNTKYHHLRVHPWPLRGLWSQTSCPPCLRALAARQRRKICYHGRGMGGFEPFDTFRCHRTSRSSKLDDGSKQDTNSRGSLVWSKRVAAYNRASPQPLKTWWCSRSQLFRRSS
jgi:hypothetical protein